MLPNCEWNQKQKVFVLVPQYFSTEPGLCRPLKKHPIKSRDLIGCSLFLCPNWGGYFTITFVALPLRVITYTPLLSVTLKRSLPLAKRTPPML